jgi:hypothetical protein
MGHRTRHGRRALRQGDGEPAAGRCRPRRGGAGVGEVDAQQGEGVDDDEPGAGEAGGGIGEERTGADHAQVGLVVRQRLDP